EEQAQQLTEAVAVFKVAEHAPVARQLSAIANAPANARSTPRPIARTSTPAPVRRSTAAASATANDVGDWQEF
ncbi:hypothetical protein, partial [Xanthomonas arboricola]